MGFSQAGNAFQQHVAAGDDRQQQVFHHVLLADHFLCDFRADLRIFFRERFDRLIRVHVSFLPLIHR